ncbi:MAG: DUF2851 family protein [Ignavibacteria bacterium]
MKPKLNINENFICRLWEGGISYYNNLVTDSGDDVEVIEHGKRNYDAGPDYKNARVKIAGKTFTGDVEIHRDFKDWHEHSHPKDRRYNSVILHVVLWDSEERTPPKLRIKRDLPSVVLANHLTGSIHDIWQDIIAKPSEKFRLPCYERNHLADDELILNWFDRLASERLNLRAERIKSRILEFSQGMGTSVSVSKKKSIWEQALYEYIFEALGFAKNKEQMLKLSGIASLKLISKQFKGNMNDIQAILFGVSGLLFDVRTKDPYIDEIKSKWKEFENKLKTEKLERSYWNFFGQRPQNFPTIRVAYGSQVVKNILEKELSKNIIEIFTSKIFDTKKAVIKLNFLFEPSKDEYWSTHYDFGKVSKSKNILAGKQRINDIIINVLLPFVIVYSEIFNKPEITENAFRLYREFKISADNSIIRVVNDQLIQNRNIKINTPALEQAVIQLYNFYCTREKCAKCDIGKNVLKGEAYDYKIIYY